MDLSPQIFTDWLTEKDLPLPSFNHQKDIFLEVILLLFGTTLATSLSNQTSILLYSPSPTLTSFLPPNSIFFLPLVPFLLPKTFIQYVASIH